MSDSDSPADLNPIAVLTNFFLRVLRRRRISWDAKRRSIVRELIQTEKNYVDSLLICEEVYYKPIDRSITSKAPLIDAPTLAELFGNLDQIREAHQIIVREMDEVLPRLKRMFPPHGFYLRVASPFTEIVPRMLQLYTEYLASNSHAEDILKRLNKNKKFRNFLSECLFNPRSKCQEIEDLLILPTQRVAGYKMLFERVIKYFPVETHGPVREAYQSTFDALLRLGASMNQEKAEMGSQEKLLTIVETLTKIPPTMCILKPGRKYEGAVVLKALEANGKRGKQHCIYVTSDLLIIGQRSEGSFSSSKWQYTDAIPITQVRFSASPVEANIERAFVLQSDTERYGYLMKSVTERDTFIDAIKAKKKAIKAQIARQTQDGAEYIQGLLQTLTRLYMAPSRPLSREEALDSIQ
jgi:hypothetical protein